MTATPLAGAHAAEALAMDLHAVGVSCTVEARHGLAVILVGAGDMAAFSEPARRRDVLALARTHGFTHAAVELTIDRAAAGAPVLRA